MPPTRLDHIAIALPRIADAPPILVDLLGGVPGKSHPGRGFRWATWLFEGGGCIEILEPMGPDGFLRRFLAAHGSGVHHVTFKVPGLDAACRRAGEHGYDIVGRDESDPTWKEAFLHPKQAQGIVVQIVESVVEPPDGPPAPPAVRILGLRLRARSRERALAQWRDVLGGSADGSPDHGLIFRWPDSPLRLAVEIDAAAPEGPLALELVGDRAPASLDEASARLGIRLRPA